ncbi:zinc finger protein 79-like isoform X4 [Corythoichthys intestinalis]|uniref:zinc finger protein 79-like isoform X4 n=1 Tax=Corythoichthys intestinalis TaxID=161448 RepID=UPI0025A5C5BB|nr:zinc finger protein 79-like isoform X4 [Corythoichthys intestinalis]
MLASLTLPSRLNETNSALPLIERAQPPKCPEITRKRTMTGSDETTPPPQAKQRREMARGEDGGLSEASRGAERPSGSSSSSKEGFQADNLIARPSESDAFTSHSLFCFRKYLGSERQESESPGVKEEVVHLQIKKEEPDDPEQQKRDKHLPIKREEVEFTQEVETYVEEENDITRPTGEPLKSEEGLSETSRGAEPPIGSSSSTEGLQADSFTAPLSDSEDAISHLPDSDDGHKNSDDKHKCSHCVKTFINKYRCHRHMRSHTGEKPFCCSVCGQRFSQTQHLKRHTRTHTGEKPFCCSVCGQRFSEKGNLKQHTRNHTGEKPFACSVCGQRFSRKSHLNAHAATHTGQKPFSCSVCGQRFSQTQHLKRHTRTHTGEKPFSCSVCGQRFSEKGNLKQHRRTHTGEKAFSCSVCGQRFSHKGSLIEHTRTHTGEKPFSC